MVRQLRTLLALSVTCLVLVAALAWNAAPPDRESRPGRLPVLEGGGARWYRGNLHTHSLWSDGDDFPEMIADWYRRHGYHFLALSDHNVLSEGERWIPVTEKSTRPRAVEKYRERFGSHWVEERKTEGKHEVRLKPLAEFRSLLEEPGKFLLVPAEEITSSHAKFPVHVNAINLRDPIKPIKGDSVTETISVNHRLVAEQARKSKSRMFAFLNHPNFGWGVTAEDMVGASELRYFEIYNGHPGVRNEGDPDHPSCERLWDIVLASRLGKHGLEAVLGLATDDAHRYHEWGVGKVNPGRGWIMVRAPYLSAEAIVRAMESSDFYCSTGVALKDVTTRGGELALKIHDQPGVRYRTEFVATMKDVSLDSRPRLGKDGKPLPVTRIYDEGVGKVIAVSSDLEPRYRLTGNELYVRARVISSRPHPNPYRKGDVEMAWTQPVVPGRTTPPRP